MEPFIEIDKRRIGPGYSTYVVAEMSANHNQDFDQAITLLHEAKRVGADAIKLQTYTPDTITLCSETKPFRISGGTLWDGETMYGLYSKGHTPWEWQPKLKAVADEIGLAFFSTAYDPTAVDFLEKLNVPAHKVASFEIVDIPLIEKIARTGKPLMISTGMASLAEVDEAVLAARNAGAQQIALLKCTSAYPSPPEAMNLRTIPHMAERFQVPVGLSDHSLGIAAPVAAVALGACIVEKHFTLSRSIAGLDSSFSLEPHELKTMIEAIRACEKAVGRVYYGLDEQEEKSRVFRRSLFVVDGIKSGERFTSENVRSIRPSDGLHPRYLHQIIGRRAAQDVQRGTPLAWDMIGKDQQE